MGFDCPHCQTTGSLQIITGVDLPSDERSDEIAIQTIECSHCGKHGMAIYEESRRGALDEDHWSHTGFWLNENSKTRLDLLLKDCTGTNAEESIKILNGIYKNKFVGSRVEVDWNSGFEIEK